MDFISHPEVNIDWGDLGNNAEGIQYFSIKEVLLEKIHKLHNLYYLPNRITVIKSRRAFSTPELMRLRWQKREGLCSI
jgi:hypothetical protein